LHPVVRTAAREVKLRRDARVLGVSPVVQEAVDHLQGVVSTAELHQLTGRQSELGDSAVDVLRAREGFGKTQMRKRIGRVEVDNLAEDVDRLFLATLALQARRDLVERREGVARQSELLVKLCELGRDV
jgi:hypothetical protein